ncbi:uncharacterized protein [Diadema antillarum]|uniref:uncharacterized protein n=1 Tax=Diadema antillarum TaxID=105358 RepID=UPI003A8C3882
MSQWWTIYETAILINLWREDDIFSRVAATTTRSKKVYDAISEKLKSVGIEKTAKQVKSKLKNLKAEYKREKGNNKRSGNERGISKYYDILDEVLGGRHVVETMPMPASVSDSVDQDDPDPEESETDELRLELEDKGGGNPGHNPLVDVLEVQFSDCSNTVDSGAESDVLEPQADDPKEPNMDPTDDDAAVEADNELTDVQVQPATASRKRPGVTMKQTWEGLNRTFNSALSQRKKKTSNGGQGHDKPWKFESSMSFVKAVKEKRNIASNLEEIGDSEGDENLRRGMFEQVVDESGIYEIDDDDEDNLAPSTSFKPIPQKPSTKSRASKRKATDDTHDVARAGLYKVMTQCLEQKQKSPRLQFFESIMPRVDEMADDRFLDFQIEVLSCLKRFGQQDPVPEGLNDSHPV